MVTRDLLRARVAVSTLFIVNSLAISVWLPRIPEIQGELGMSDGQLGLVLAVGSAGGLVIGPMSGHLIARSNSARVSVVSFAVTLPALLLIGLVPTGWALALVLFWFGAFDAIMDGAMNSHAFRLQDLYGRSIINNFHGYWSLATVAGALIGSLTLAAGLSPFALLSCVCVFGTLAVAVTARWLLPGPDPQARDVDHDAELVATDLVDPGSVLPTAFPRPLLGRAALLLGIFTLLAILVEDVPSRWSAVYLVSLSAPVGLVGLGLTAFASAMTVGRFAGDAVVNRYGERMVVRVGMIASATVMTAALIAAQPLPYIAACFVAGLGVATVFPAAMHAATHLEGVRPAMGVAVVAWFSRAGGVLAPLAVGFISQSMGIGWGMAVPVAASLVLAGMAGLMRSSTRTVN